MPDAPKNKKRGSAIPGIAVFGCLVTGLSSLIAAFRALHLDQTAGAGVCFLAAAAAFGVVAWISFTD